LHALSGVFPDVDISLGVDGDYMQVKKLPRVVSQAANLPDQLECLAIQDAQCVITTRDV
jgi:hypothetical protein